eukprot:15015250-Ditylum_brightwellii.AAC.1
MMLAKKSCCNKYSQDNLDNSDKYLLQLMQDMYRSMIQSVDLKNRGPEIYAMKLDYAELFPDELLPEIYTIYKESSDLKFKL